MRLRTFAIGLAVMTAFMMLTVSAAAQHDVGAGNAGDALSGHGQRASSPANPIIDGYGSPAGSSINLGVSPESLYVLADAGTSWRLSVHADAGLGHSAAATVFQDAPAPNAEGGDDSAAIAKKLANPVADLISVPIQFNFDEPFGPADAARYTANVQPVIPFSIAPEWNVISRTILPLIYQEAPAAGLDDEFGMGDIVQSFFFSPKESSPIWGLGPVLLLPTATDDSLGGEKWGAGPSGVVLVQDGPWTYGVLANHIWSYAGDDDRESISNSLVQPFIAYTTPTAMTITLNTESTYDWTDSQWTVPVNLQVSQLLVIGGQPVSLGVGGRWYAEAADDGPEWGLRFTLTFLFPR